MSSVTVGIAYRRIKQKRRESMQGRKTCAIGVDDEHRATAKAVVTALRPIQGVARQNQSLVGVVVRNACRETMQGRKTRVIGVEGKQCAISRSATSNRCPVHGVA